VAYHRDHFTPQNLTVGVIGGYPEGFEQRLKTDLEANLPADPAVVPGTPSLPVVPREPGIDVLLIDKPCRSTAISVGHPIDVSRRDRDYYALLVANSFLGEHRTFYGLLMRSLRALRGLNYGDYSYIEHFIQDRGTRFAQPNIPRRQQDFTIWIRPVAPENAQFALRLAIFELSRLVERGLTSGEFERTRSFLLGYTRLWSQTPDRRLGIVLDSRWYGMQDDFIPTIDEVLPTLTLEEVNAALRKYIHPTELRVVMVCPNAEELRAHLLDNDPSPIVYPDRQSTAPAVAAEDDRVSRYPLPIRDVRVVEVRDLFE
jgi:zinc protease